MSNDDSFAIGTLIVITVLVIIAAITFSPSICHLRWAGSGFETQYSYITGCNVEIEEGKYVPEDMLSDFYADRD